MEDFTPCISEGGYMEWCLPVASISRVSPSQKLSSVFICSNSLICGFRTQWSISG